LSQCFGKHADGHGRVGNTVESADQFMTRKEQTGRVRGMPTMT
jgi:hypothetical protein